MINCQRCGAECVSESITGKQTKNCKSCRDEHNDNGKKNAMIRRERLPLNNSFYKQEKINIVNDNLEEPPDEQQNDTRPSDVLHVQQPEKTKTDKNIRDLLHDVFNTLEHLEEANAEHMKQTDALTNIVFNILNKLITSEDKINDFIKNQDLKNNCNNGNNEFNDFIKNQDLKNKDFNFKLDKIIACVV